MSDVGLCPKCKALAAVCETPIGDGAETLCWLCAHDVVRHGATLEGGPRDACGCSKQEIYPSHIVERMAQAVMMNETKLRKEFDLSDDDTLVVEPFVEAPRYVGRHSQRVLEMRKERVARVQSHRTGEHPTEN